MLESLHTQLQVPLLIPWRPSTNDFLQRLYIGRLDTSLIASIALETKTVNEAQKILDPLAEAAEEEEKYRQAFSQQGSPTPSAPLSSEEEHIKVDTLSDAEAFQFLRITFPRPSEGELTKIIAASGGDVRKAVDTLLNTEYLNTSPVEEHSPERGTHIGDYDDDDDEDSIWARQRPGGAVSRPKLPAVATGNPFPSLQTPSSPQKTPLRSRSDSPVRSKWDALDAQIAFLSNNLSIPSAKVRSAFHANASSLPRALRALLQDIPRQFADRDVVRNLKITFKHVDEELLQKIVSSTKHNFDIAIELSRILENDRYFSGSQVRLSTISSQLPRVHSMEATGKHDPSTLADDDSETLDDVKTLQSYYLEKRNLAFAAASQSYRHSKSDSLHSGVAAYYASLGREYDSKYRQYSKIVATRLVAHQSTRNTLDLHGVGVKDAVRIVEEEVTAWWARVQVIRERGQVKALESFVIIVGRGERRRGGSRLGPSVGGWLKRNGWGYQEARGELIVWGLRKEGVAG
jgi:hypothetical protein